MYSRNKIILFQQHPCKNYDIYALACFMHLIELQLIYDTI